MAIIIITKDEIQDHLDSRRLNYDVNSIKIESHYLSFEFSRVTADMEVDIDVSIQVDEDLRFETDDYIDIETYNETKVLLDELKEEVEKWIEIAGNQVIQLAEQASTIASLLNIAKSKRPWWKVWC